MDKDYYINDDNGYNWVSLSKPLSNYSQEELAEHLIRNKKEYGTTQKIRIDGKIGANLTTDGCETPEDFLKKYQIILDRAGFKKGNIMNTEEIKEKNTLTIKPKALSKVSFMDYTQEELAHLVMDDKINNNDGKEYGIYEHRDTIFDSTGCNTIEDFINKYQDEFKKRRIKPENHPAEKNPTKKNAMRIIEVPLGMYNYTQEDLAHLVMDNKNLDEVVGIRINNGAILDSEGCNTVEDFINKNEKVANLLGIKHNLDEKIEKAKVMEENKYSIKIDPIIPKVSVSGPINKVEENKEEIKIQEPKLSYEENIKKLLDDTEIKKTICLFDIARGNYYNGTGSFEESKLDTIQEKNKEYVKLFAEKDNVDFNNENEVSEWFNKLIPYINTHALNLNLGINVTTKSADKYLLEFMEEKGYSSNIESAVSPKQKEIAQKLNELKEYGFFVSDYKNLPEENKNLNSEKTLAMAEINYLELLNNSAMNGINKINLDIVKINNEGRKEKELLEAKVSSIDRVLVGKINSEFDNEVASFEEINANDAYKIASITHENSDVEKAIAFASLIPEDSKVKEKISDASYNLFTADPIKDYEKYPELHERDKYIEKLDNYDEEKENVIARLYSKQKMLIDNMAKLDVKIVGLRHKFNIGNEEEIKEETIEESSYDDSLEEDSYDLGADKKAGIVDMIKEKIAKVKEAKDLKEENHIDTEYLNKLESVGAVFTDQERIDPNHDYLTADNAKNLSLIDTVEEGPKEEVISKIEMEDEQEEIAEVENTPLETTEVKGFELEEDDHEPVKFENNDDDEEFNLDEFDLDDDQYDLTLDDLKDSLKNFVAINSFKQISKDLYEKINKDKVKKVVKKAVEKLNQSKKAACLYLGFAATFIAGFAAGNNIKSLSVDNNDLQTKIAIEQTQEETNENTEVDTLDDVKTEENANAIFEEEPEYTVSLQDASSETIADVIEGKTDVYRSFADAYTETNAVDASKVYVPSWENAKGGEYFVEQDGVMNRLSKDEAEDYFNNGGDIVQSVQSKDDGTVIGYVNIENNNNVGKSM